MNLYKSSLKLLQNIILLILIQKNYLNFVECAKIIQTSITKANINNCTLDLTNVPLQEPLYLNKISGRYKFFEPQFSTNTISNNHDLLFNCPGKRNSIIANNKNLNVQELKITCRNGIFLTDNLEIFDIKNILCEKSITSDIQTTQELCATDQGYIYNVGFYLNSQNFLTLFKICYNNLRDKTIYSKHLINGKAIQHSIKQNKSGSFKIAGISSDDSRRVQKFYQKNNQIANFQKVFGIDQLYVDDISFLARGHLTPVADFIFSSAQLATYFYINAAPEFQVINSGNWKRIENLARNLASSYKNDFEIYTGIFDQLKLLNKKEENVPIYLDDNQNIEVPKWFWKVIRNKKTNYGIVLITLNNPFATEGKSEEFCPNICESAGIRSQNFKILSKGYSFCCEVQTFKDTVKDLPKDFTVSGLLDCSVVNVD